MENVAFQRVRYFVRLYFPRRVWLAGRIAFSPFLKMLHYLYYYCYLKFGDFHIYYPVLGFFFLRCCFFHIQRKWHLFGCKFLKRFLFLSVATSVLAPSVFVLIPLYNSNRISVLALGITLPHLPALFGWSSSEHLDSKWYSPTIYNPEKIVVSRVHKKMKTKVFLVFLHRTFCIYFANIWQQHEYRQGEHLLSQ